MPGEGGVDDFVVSLLDQLDIQLRSAEEVATIIAGASVPVLGSVTATARIAHYNAPEMKYFNNVVICPSGDMTSREQVSVCHAEDLMRSVVDSLNDDREGQQPLVFADFKVKCMTSTASVGRPVDLRRLSDILPPEHPNEWGANVRWFVSTRSGDVVVDISSTGKISLTEARTEQQTLDVFNLIMPVLAQFTPDNDLIRVHEQ
jgi:hypothetical protein